MADMDDKQMNKLQGAGLSCWVFDILILLVYPSYRYDSMSPDALKALIVIFAVGAILFIIGCKKE
jgi:hypothetical protein